MNRNGLRARSSAAASQVGKELAMIGAAENALAQGQSHQGEGATQPVSGDLLRRRHAQQRPHVCHQTQLEHACRMFTGKLRPGATMMPSEPTLYFIEALMSSMLSCR